MGRTAAPRLRRLRQHRAALSGWLARRNPPERLQAQRRLASFGAANGLVAARLPGAERSAGGIPGAVGSPGSPSRHRPRFGASLLEAGPAARSYGPAAV